MYRLSRQEVTKLVALVDQDQAALDSLFRLLTPEERQQLIDWFAEEGEGGGYSAEFVARQFASHAFIAALLRWHQREGASCQSKREVNKPPGERSEEVAAKLHAHLNDRLKRAAEQKGGQ